MRKFHVKSLILGIGIGIVITALISMIYLAGSEPGSILSDKDIIERAGRLGMVKAEDIAGDKSGEAEQKDKDSGLLNTAGIKDDELQEDKP